MTPTDQSPDAVRAAIRKADPGDLISDFAVAAHRRLDASDRERMQYYQDRYERIKTELLRRLAQSQDWRKDAAAEVFSYADAIRWTSGDIDDD